MKENRDIPESGAEGATRRPRPGRGEGWGEGRTQASLSSPPIAGKQHAEAIMMLLLCAQNNTRDGQQQSRSCTMKVPRRPKATSDHMRERARRLRKDSTIPERVLWTLLRDRRLSGVKFRRQHPIGPYVVDFYCPSHGLIVELDGRSHDDRGIRDQAAPRLSGIGGGISGIPNHE